MVYTAKEIKAISDDVMACKSLERTVIELKSSYDKDLSDVEQEIYDSELMEFIRVGLTTRFYKCVQENFSDEEKKSYIDSWRQAIKRMSVNGIYEASILLPYKSMVYEYYFGDDIVKKIRRIEERCLYWNDQEVVKLSNGSLINLELTEIKSASKTVILEGFDYSNALADNFEVIVTDENGEVYKPQYTDWYRRDRFDFAGEKICKAKKFKFEIPCDKVRRYKFVLTDGEERIVIRPVFGQFSKFNNRAKGSYYSYGGYIITLGAKSRFIIQRYKKSLAIKKEFKYQIMLARKAKIKAMWLRLRYFMEKGKEAKPIWLFRDNEKRAKDSAIVMFKKFNEFKNHDKYKAYFILDKESEDYQMAKSYGDIIQPYTMQYKLKSLLADKLVDTRGSISPKYIFGRDEVFVRDLCTWDYIWLIHGVMTRNESTWTGKFDINAKIYATCGKRECEAVMDIANGYGYENGEAQITGLPRHDDLVAHKKKNVLFMPTWRKEYAGELIPGTSDREYVDNFKDSEFYKFYNKLINDERLLKVMREKGYDGDFYLHPSFIKQWQDFDGNDCIRIGQKPADTNELVSQCSILVTDFSSVAFDAAYLETPVVYTQYDIDTFGERHTGKDGYFEYERDGFGEVCVDYDDAVEEIIRTIKSNCKMGEIYKKRVDEFFVYKDGKSSMRVYDAMEKLD